MANATLCKGDLFRRGSSVKSNSKFVSRPHSAGYCDHRTEAARTRTPRCPKTLPNVSWPFRSRCSAFIRQFLIRCSSWTSAICRLHAQDTPIFQFQKPNGSSAILLPDIDFLGLDFYHQPGYADKIPYQEKATSAIFVGGTSGQVNTVETVREPVAPRLQAGKHFRGHPDIHFLLTTLSRCQNAEAEQALRDLGFGGPTVPWSEQFPHKFIISVDGNGATCSRVVIALKSNSALLKYNSPHHLYYFKGLVPWLHYVPIVEHGDIENIIKIERECPGTFASIAEEGRRFAETYINRQRVFQYVAELLTHYAVHVYPARSVNNHACRGHYIATTDFPSHPGRNRFGDRHGQVIAASTA